MTEHVHHAGCGCYSPDALPVHRPQPLPTEPQQQAVPQVVHVHQAPPDRTVQRVALGAGIGAGTVAAGVYFGPLLVAAMTSMAISLAVVALVVAVVGWTVVSVVRAVGGPEGTQAAKNLKRRKG
ncbi:DUF6251 family protein [Streptomyces sp. S07_1.15]|uniref:DUF6251 family protein n=1 Tax=Streptomyces sp. S07_1.15 TaxID=2873925 RepID=UPI001D14C534|nr:DUF6251 family protein [Streptomyces sp. S07_1.15]MCC3652718.1 DUF6251 family protein [Streptomyces sp. S07_1.15]